MKTMRIRLLNTEQKPMYHFYATAVKVAVAHHDKYCPICSKQDVGALVIHNRKVAKNGN
jgi:hypothetical protein